MTHIDKVPTHVALTFPRTYSRILSSAHRYADSLSRGFLIFTLISEILRIVTYLYEHGVREVTVDLLPRPVIDKLKIDIDFVEHVLIKVFQRIENIDPTIIIFDDNSIRRVIFTGSENKIFKLNMLVGYDQDREIKRALELSLIKLSQEDSKDIMKTLSIFRNNLVLNNDPDLAIIFGEEIAPSFIPLELAYSELVYIDKEIVDVRREDIEKALLEFSRRCRRFGR
ncbi:MAG: hypothetical protein GXO10_05735 [Crenarchaeota archaeon]|nr:hypothetical protein [Thermoproteota archaeon]